MPACKGATLRRWWPTPRVPTCRSRGSWPIPRTPSPFCSRRCTLPGLAVVGTDYLGTPRRRIPTTAHLHDDTEPRLVLESTAPRAGRCPARPGRSRGRVRGPGYSQATTPRWRRAVPPSATARRFSVVVAPPRRALRLSACFCSRSDRGLPLSACASASRPAEVPGDISRRQHGLRASGAAAIEKLLPSPTVGVARGGQRRRARRHERDAVAGARTHCPAASCGRAG